MFIYFPAGWLQIHNILRKDEIRKNLTVQAIMVDGNGGYFVPLMF